MRLRVFTKKYNYCHWECIIMRRRLSVLILITALLCTFIAPSAVAETTWEVKIRYNGEWSGSVGGSNSASYEGTGGKTITVTGDIVSAVIQKQEDNSDELCVELWTGGEMKESSCTTAGYGVASVSASDLEEVPGFGFLGGIAALCLASIVLNRNSNK
jgi:hypothetical protein